MDYLQHALVVDLVEPGKLIGFPTADPHAPSLRGTRDGHTWRVYAGDQDQYRAKGSTLDIALRRLAKQLGLTGTAHIAKEYGDWAKRAINLA